MVVRVSVLLLCLCLSGVAHAGVGARVYPPCSEDDARDCYQVLGAEPDWTRDEILSAYRKLAKKFHPDSHPGNTDAAIEFKAINEAWHRLDKEENRNFYDSQSVRGRAVRSSTQAGYESETDSRAKAVLFMIAEYKKSRGIFTSRSLQAIIDAIPFHFQKKRNAIRAFAEKYKGNAEYGEIVVYAVATYWLQLGNEDGKIAYRNFRFDLQLERSEFSHSRDPNAAQVVAWKTKLLKQMDRARETVFPPSIFVRAAKFCYEAATGDR